MEHDVWRAQQIEDEAAARQAREICRNCTNFRAFTRIDLDVLCEMAPSMSEQALLELANHGGWCSVQADAAAPAWVVTAQDLECESFCEFNGVRLTNFEDDEVWA